MILEQKYRPGFVLYPSMVKVTDGLFEFKYCQTCGRQFIREIKIARVHRHTSDCYLDALQTSLKCRIVAGSIDESGVLALVGPKYCARCTYAPQFTRPEPTELEEEVKEQKLKWRRRGADHSQRKRKYDAPIWRKLGSARMNWKFLVASVELELFRRGKMNSRDIGQFCKYKGSGAIAVSNLERCGLKLKSIGDEFISFETRSNVLSKTRVRIYALSGEVAVQ